MTIVLDFGTWHVEVVEAVIAVPAGASRTDSAAINLIRPGTFIGGSCFISDGGVNDDHIHNVGAPSFFGNAATLLVGNNINTVTMRVWKGSSTNTGDITVQAIIIIRDSR